MDIEQKLRELVAAWDSVPDRGYMKVNKRTLTEAADSLSTLREQVRLAREMVADTCANVNLGCNSSMAFLAALAPEVP